MKIAVTGAAGYLAQGLIPVLEADDSIEQIVATDIVQPPKTKKMSFFQHDVRDPAIAEIFKGCDALVHLAFIVMPIRSEVETDSINIGGSMNVFRQAAAAGVKKVVYLSSVAAYGAWPDNPPQLFEDSPLRPMRRFYYSRTKGAVEFWLDRFEREHCNMAIVRLRPCIFVGPKINNMMTEMVTSKKLPRFRGYNPQMQFVWDEDVVDAIVLALKKDVRGAFNIAPDNPILMEDIARITGAQVATVPYPVAYWMVRLIWALRLHKSSHAGWLEIARYPLIMNCDKAKKELGWSPSLNCAEVIERFVRELRI